MLILELKNISKMTSSLAINSIFNIETNVTSKFEDSSVAIILTEAQRLKGLKISEKSAQDL